MPIVEPPRPIRTLALGDIHGCLKSLETLAQWVPFKAGDRLVLLGDYLDRGPDSRGVIDWVLAASRVGEVIALRGNHEAMMLEARTNLAARAMWIENGGVEALASYGTSIANDWISKVPPAHWAFLESTGFHFETERFIFVHGGVDWDKPLAEQNAQREIWTRCTGMRPHVSGKRVICGHTPQPGGRIGVYQWGLCLDTDCCRGEWLTCLDVESGEYWQANEGGGTRGGKLNQA